MFIFFLLKYKIVNRQDFKKKDKSIIFDFFLISRWATINTCVLALNLDHSLFKYDFKQVIYFCQIIRCLVYIYKYKLYIIPFWYYKWYLIRKIKINTLLSLTLTPNQHVLIYFGYWNSTNLKIVFTIKHNLINHIEYDHNSSR